MPVDPFLQSTWPVALYQFLVEVDVECWRLKSGGKAAVAATRGGDGGEMQTIGERRRRMRSSIASLSLSPSSSSLVFIRQKSFLPILFLIYKSFTLKTQQHKNLFTFTMRENEWHFFHYREITWKRKLTLDGIIFDKRFLQV